MKQNAYSQRFINAELQKVREGEVFVALADYAFIQDLFLAGHYVRRQAHLATELKKPVLLVFEVRVPEAVRQRVRTFYPTLDTEITFDSRNPRDRQKVLDAAEAILQRLHPDEIEPKAKTTDAFNDPLHGLERIG